MFHFSSKPKSNGNCDFLVTIKFIKELELSFQRGLQHNILGILFSPLGQVGCDNCDALFVSTWNQQLLRITFSLICLLTYLCVGKHVRTHVWKLSIQRQELAPSFHHVVFSNEKLGLLENSFTHWAILKALIYSWLVYATEILLECQAYESMQASKISTQRNQHSRKSPD